MLRSSLWCLAVCLLASAQAPAQKRAMTLEDLFALQRVADPQLSPDGRFVTW